MWVEKADSVNDHCLNVKMAFFLFAGNLSGNYKVKLGQKIGFNVSYQYESLMEIAN